MCEFSAFAAFNKTTNGETDIELKKENKNCWMSLLYIAVEKLPPSQRSSLDMTRARRMWTFQHLLCRPAASVCACRKRRRLSSLGPPPQGEGVQIRCHPLHHPWWGTIPRIHKLRTPHSAKPRTSAGMLVSTLLEKFWPNAGLLVMSTLSVKPFQARECPWTHCWKSFDQTQDCLLVMSTLSAKPRPSTGMLVTNTFSAKSFQARECPWAHCWQRFYQAQECS